MKRALKITGLVSLGIVIFAVLFIFIVVVPKGRVLDRESKAYADTAIVAIVSHWSSKELADRASPRLVQAIGGISNFDRVMNMFRPLGPLQLYQGSVGQSNINFWLGRGVAITARYVAHARFQNGDAIIDLALEKEDGRWQIIGFHVSPQYVPSATSTPPK